MTKGQIVTAAIEKANTFNSYYSRYSATSKIFPTWWKHRRPFHHGHQKN